MMAVGIDHFTQLFSWFFCGRDELESALLEGLPILELKALLELPKEESTMRRIEEKKKKKKKKKEAKDCQSDSPLKQALLAKIQFLDAPPLVP